MIQKNKGEKMRVNILKELKPYSFFELQEMFCVSEDKLKNMLKSLSMMNITRRLTKNLSNIELSELVDIENIHELNMLLEGNIFVFKYVGILVIGNICLIIYPKYVNNFLIDRNNDFKLFNQIISVIMKYKARYQYIGVNEAVESLSSNFLSLALDLIYSYHEYGLYNNDEVIYEINGDGEILWDKTINENTVYFSNDVPIYLDTITVNQKTNESDYFRKLHALIVTLICDKLEDLLNILGIENINISTEKLDNFGNREYILYRLKNELTTQFVTWKQDVLVLLKKIIEEDFSGENSESLSFVGTTSYASVWEDVCSVVMGNCMKKKLKELGLKYSKINKDSALILDVISKPLWFHNESKITHNAQKTLKPDIITIENNCLNIYDAKYYNIILDEINLKNNPGVGDVTKQYLYELAYTKFAQENNLKINSNAFLFPTDDKVERSIGFVNIDLLHSFGEIKLKDIELILKPCEEMYCKYLNL